MPHKRIQSMPESRRNEMRSRNGCTACKKRRRKCTEERPRCRGCSERNLTCNYSVRVQWAQVATIKRSTESIVNKQTREHVLSPDPPPPVDVDFESQGSDHDREEAVASLFQLSAGRPLITNAAFLSQQESLDGLFSESVAAHPTSFCEELGRSVGFDTFSDTSERIEDGMLNGWELNDCEIFSQINPSSFGSPGERIAFVYWFNYLSGVLPAHDSAENPYRRLSKLALASPVLLNTIISLATEYMYCHGRSGPDLVMKRHDKALASLREALAGASSPSLTMEPDSGDLTPKQATLAAVLLQVANVVFIGGSGVDMHLTIAMHFLQDLGYVQTPTEDFIARLLVQRFAILDVTIAILRRRRPHLPPTFWLFAPDEKYDRTAPSFREMTGCPQPVLGFFSRLAHLVVDLKESTKSEYSVRRSASTLETDMRIYARSCVTFTTTRPTKTRHLDSLGQCFYWCAHLILQRAIYHDPASSARVQHTVQDIVMLIKSMPLGCGPDSSLAFPFYLSSREATTQEHRDWVRQRNQELKLVYPGRTRDASMTLLEDIWAAAVDATKEMDALNQDMDGVVENLELSRDFCLF